MEELLLKSLNEFDKKPANHNVSDMEIEDLFNDSKSMKSFSRELMKKGTISVQKQTKKDK